MTAKEEAAIIVPSNEFDPVLEEKVRYYLGLTPDLPKNEVIPIRAKEPEGADPYEVEIWRREEFRRIKEGHFDMSPKQYFWYNYVRMWDIETGLIRPEYRVCQQEWFRQIESAQDSKEFGVICVKRRRVGASWLMAADAYHDCLMTAITGGRIAKVGMTSKTAIDAIELFKKFKFIYDNLPDWLRLGSSAGNTLTSINFSEYIKDSSGSRKQIGTRAEVIVKPPTDTSWEGYALNKWIADEAGKIEGIKSLFSMSNEVMRIGTRRIGTPILFGTAGDIGKEGAGLKEMWYNSDIYKLNKFFFGGWMGLIVDKCGNDMKEEAIRWIVYERKRREGLSQKEFNDFLQQYPLTVQEAFTSNEQQGLGNQMHISKQLNSLYENPVKNKRGFFKLDANEQVVFSPTNRGQCIIYEEPDPTFKNNYCASCDPTDHPSDAPGLSSLAMYIMKKQDSATPPKIVFEYVDRPHTPADFYEQALMALIYYNKTKILIERNKFGMVTYFDERGYKHLLQTSPQGYTRLLGGNTYNIGYYRTPGAKAYCEELVIEYVQNHCDYIPSKELLQDFQEYGVRNTDRADAFQGCLMLLKEVMKQKPTTVSAENSKIPKFGLDRVNGTLTRYRTQNGSKQYI